LCTRAAVQAWAGITFVYIQLAAVSFITGITLTDAFHTGSVLSTIYPHTWANHVTKFSYVAVCTDTDTIIAGTMRSALYSLTRVGLPFKNENFGRV
jgi:hypothetical protein